MASIVEDNPKDMEMWIQAFEAKFEGKGKPFTRDDWDQLLGHCMAVSDSPCISFVDELAAAYPDAKIILSLRDSKEQWYKSVEQTLVPVAKLMGMGAQLVPFWERVYRWFLPRLPLPKFHEKLEMHTNISK